MIAEDAVDEEEEEDNYENNPFESETLNLDDPKKTLRGWYEREGHHPPEYQVDDVSGGVFRCKIEYVYAIRLIHSFLIDFLFLL